MFGLPGSFLNEAMVQTGDGRSRTGSSRLSGNSSLSFYSLRFSHLAQSRRQRGGETGPGPHRHSDGFQSAKLSEELKQTRERLQNLNNPSQISHNLKITVVRFPFKSEIDSVHVRSGFLIRGFNLWVKPHDQRVTSWPASRRHVTCGWPVSSFCWLLQPLAARRPSLLWRPGRRRIKTQWDYSCGGEQVPWVESLSSGVAFKSSAQGGWKQSVRQDTAAALNCYQH